MKRLILIAALALAACSNRPVDATDICDAALEGVPDSDWQTHDKCRQDVSWAAYHAGHQAAKPYRDIVR